MKRVILRAALLSLIVPALALIWVTTTESGLSWLASRLVAVVPGQLTFASIDGRLLGNIVIKDMHYRQPDFELKADTLSLDWSPSALLAMTLRTRDVDADKVHVETTTDPSTPLWPLPEIHFPMAIRIDHAHIGELNVVVNGHRTPSLEKIELKANTRGQLVIIKQLAAASAQHKLEVAGQFSPQGNYPLDGTIKWTTRANDRSWQGQATVTGNLEQLAWTNHVNVPISAMMKGVFYDPLTHLRWDAQVDLAQIDIQTLNPNWSALHLGGRVNAEGDFDHARAKSEVKLLASQTGPVTVHSEISWSRDESLTLNHIKAVGSSGAVVQGDGKWPLARNGVPTLNLNWSNLTWPLQGKAIITSAAGDARISGSPDRYHLVMDAQLSGEKLPQSRWHVVATGDKLGAHFETIDTVILDGTVSGTAQVSWSPAITWSSRLRAHNLHPENLAKAWPGEVSFELMSDGRFEQEINTNIVLTQLAGVLRGYPVAAIGAIDVQGQVVTVKQFKLTSGQSNVDIKGVIDPHNTQLGWQVHSSSLAQLHPRLSGSLTARGEIYGPQASLGVRGEMQADHVRFNQLTLRAADAEFDVIPAEWGVHRLRLSGRDWQVGGRHIDTIRVAVEETDRGNRADVDLVSKGQTLTLQADSVLEKGRLFGTVTQAAVSLRDGRRWQLEAPAPFSATDTGFALSLSCLRHENSALCVRVDRQQDRWDGELRVVRLPLALLAPIFGPDTSIGGDTNGAITFSYNADAKRLEANGQLKAAPGSVVYKVMGVDEKWDFEQAVVMLSIKDHLLRVQTGLSLPSGDHASVTLRLPEFDLGQWDPARQRIEGEIEGEISDISLIEAMVDEIQGAKGRLRLKMTVGGTWAAPEGVGSLRLEQGSLKVNRLGLNVRDIEAIVKGDQQQLRYQLTATSGDGQLRVEGETRLEPKQGWPTTLHIVGENLQVSNIPEARIEVNPNLEVRSQRREIHVTGEIVVPQAQIRPRELSGAVLPSDDVIIVGKAGPETKPEKWQIYSDIRLLLGDRVRLEGFGFEGWLNGNLLLTDRPNALTTASGEISVREGRYYAYGQRLSVERGKLIFSSGPLQSPGLDLEAVRHINDVTAGIRVRGTLQAPQIELFSVPAMSQNDALAYLLLGRPLTESSREDSSMLAQAALALRLSGGDFIARSLGERFGIDEVRLEAGDRGDAASLVIGHYLSPRLYVSYGVGLIESINTFSLRYQISKRWQLKAESGVELGADLMYTIER